MPIQTEFAFLLQVTTLPPQDFGTIHSSDKRFFPISGGTFEGPRIKGTVLPGGGDWSTVRNDGMYHLNARYAIRTDDGVTIHVHNEGYGRATRQQIRDIIDGKGFRGERYTKTWPRFEVEEEKYDWLNKSVFIADVLAPTKPRTTLVEVHRVL